MIACELNISKVGDFTSPQALVLEQAYLMAMDQNTKLSDQVLTMPGMSGGKYRTLINRLIEKTHNARYLEIGSWKGSTACSAMYGNTVTATCIDNFTFGGFSKDDLVNNTNSVITDNINFTLLDGDFRQIDYNAIGKFNVYFYDGPHQEQDQYDGIVVVQPALDDTFTLIVDDYIDPIVQRGTIRAIKDLNLTVEASIELKTVNPTVTNEFSEWHFGYFMAVLKKKLKV
jgi:hypothetical protein